VAIGAGIGGITGGFIADNNGGQWWQGAIAGAFIGATVGAWIASGVGASSMTSMLTANGASAPTISKAWGITNSMLNSATLNIANSAISGGGWDGAWKAGLMGAASGGWTATGGFGLVKKGLLEKSIFQNVGLGLRSIGNNFAHGVGAFHNYNIGIGPLQLKFGKSYSKDEYGNYKNYKWYQSIFNVNNVFHAFNLTNTFLYESNMKKFDPDNLSYEYQIGKKGLLKSLYNEAGETGIYGILGASGKFSFDVEETFHVWQSRSMGDGFIPNYLFNFLQKVSLNHNFNYFEATGMIYWQQ